MRETLPVLCSVLVYLLTRSSRRLVLRTLFAFPKQLSFLGAGLASIALHLSANSVPRLSISEAIGHCYLVEKSSNLKDSLPLKNGTHLQLSNPFTLATQKSSFLSCQLSTPHGKRILRLGRSSAIEISNEEQLFLFQGSFLVSTNSYDEFEIHSKSLQAQVSFKGTWIAESTPLGFKLIVLEGWVEILSDRKWNKFAAGQLVLVSDKNANLSKPMSIELPLLLKTSNLLNAFSTALPARNRLISAARVQSARTDKKYNALLGRLTSDRKLRIWSQADPLGENASSLKKN